MVNYLIGHHLYFFKKHGQEVIDVSEDVKQKFKDQYAEIGMKSDVSQTLFPEAFVSKTGIFYCDCPGFLDNREIEEKMAISINLELAVNNSRRVRSIIVAISFDELRATRGQAFKELYKILDKLIKGIENCSHSIIFTITKCPQDFGVKDFLSYIDDQIDSNQNFLKEQLNTILSTVHNSFQNMLSSKPNENKNQSKIKERERVLKMLYMIKENPKNILIADLKNENFLLRINSLLHTENKGIPKKLFNFSFYDNNRMLFNDFIYEKIHEGLVNLRKYVLSPIDISETQAKILDAKNKIEFFASEIEKAQDLATGRMIPNDKEIDESRKKYESFSVAATAKLQKNEEKLKVLENEKKKASLELDSLKSEKPFLVKHYLYHDKRLPLVGNFSKSSKTFKYFDSQTPILKVEKIKEKGTFRDECVNISANKENKNGYFSIKYETERGQDGDCEINLYIREKDKLENRTRIKYLQENILKVLNSKIEEIHQLIVQLKKEIQGYVKSINNLNQKSLQTFKKEYEEKKENLSKNISELKNSLQDLESNKIKRQKSFDTGDRYLKENQKSIECVKAIIILLNYNSSMAKDFIYYNQKAFEKNKTPDKPNFNEELDAKRKQEDGIFYDLFEIKTEEEFKSFSKIKEDLQKSLDFHNQQIIAIDYQLKRIEKIIKRCILDNKSIQISDEEKLNEENYELNEQNSFSKTATPPPDYSLLHKQPDNEPKIYNKVDIKPIVNTKISQLQSVFLQSSSKSEIYAKVSSASTKISQRPLIETKQLDMLNLKQQPPQVPPRPNDNALNKIDSSAAAPAPPPPPPPPLLIQSPPKIPQTKQSSISSGQNAAKLDRKNLLDSIQNFDPSLLKKPKISLSPPKEKTNFINSFAQSTLFKMAESRRPYVAESSSDEDDDEKEDYSGLYEF